MANYSKNDPNCDSTNRIIFVGNVHLRDYNERDKRYLSNANTVLVIDVIASPSWDVGFYDVNLELQIQSPNDALFVDHSGRNNYRWDIPDGAGGWIENVTPTARLRVHRDQGDLLSGTGNGLTFYVGLAGVSASDALKFTAVASAKEVRATTSSCEVTIADLHNGEGIPGYLS